MRKSAVNEIKQSIIGHLKAFLDQSNYNVTMSDMELYEQISAPPKFEAGQYALPMFLLSKQLKRKPVDLAMEFVSFLNDNNSGQFSEIKNLGPYVNFHLNFETFISKTLTSIHDQSFFQQDYFTDHQKTMIEYSQPNTHKELHVGHMRNLCLGNSIVRILRFVGTDVIASTYPGDVGTHIAKALWYLKKNNLSAPDENKGAWLGEQYSKANSLLVEQLGSEHESRNRQELTAILKELKEGTGEYFDLWKETRLWSIDLMKSIYKWADVEFDAWFFESDVNEQSLKLVEHYLEKGFFKIDEGAVGIDLDEYKLGFFMVRKSDGNGLYSTKDLELARRKFQDYKIERNLYIVDQRQSRHFKQVFKTLELMGFEHANKCEHLAYEFVELKNGAISSRKGNIVALEDLIKQMESTIIDKYLSKYSEQWTEEEIFKTAKIIANGAIKYGMLKIDSQKKIVFEMDEWLRLDGNSGPYLQYTYARIQSICDKAGSINHDFNKDLETLKEKKIVFKLSQFHCVVQEAGLKSSPSLICHYLYDLCQDFNSFYADHPIMNQEENIKNARLSLIKSFSEVLKKSLELLGIECPLRM